MKTLKWLAAGLLAATLCACSSSTTEESISNENTVENVDSQVMSEGAAEESLADENGGADADSGIEENTGSTSEVPTNADEVMEAEDQAENN